MLNNDYFRKRAVEREQHWHDLTTRELDEKVKLYYAQTLEKIQRDIESLYQRYADENGLSMLEARRLIRGKEFKRWRMTPAEYVKAAKTDSEILRELNTLAMRSRITRLEKLMAETLIEVDKLCEKTDDFLTNFLSRVYYDNYYKSLYDLHKGVGLKTPPVKVDPLQVEKVIRTAWSGANYSSRIWKNGAKLAKEIESTLSTAIHRGISTQKLSRDLARRMEVSYNNAERLVRTELNYVQNKAALDSLKSAELEHYRFVAALDNRTCPRCGGIDGQVYEVSESMPGENFPPIHPRCRCTVVPSLGEYAGKRRAGRVKVPASMSYTEWKARYVENKPVIISGSAGDIPFKKIIGVHTADEDLKAVNPNYGKGYEWSNNCQRCVPTYELRRRGYDVTAKPVYDIEKDFLNKRGNYAKVFDNPQVIRCTGEVINCIKGTMREWGEDARAEVYIVWKGTMCKQAHIFAAENRAGKIVFIDPQTSKENVESYFEKAEEGYTLIHRMDNLNFTDLIKECCEEVKK